jgi:hypothetical protein
MPDSMEEDKKQQIFQFKYLYSLPSWLFLASGEILGADLI